MIGTNSTRNEIWQSVDRDWDLIIIGGGITGVGILREATRRGLKALLVEQHDFAYGTSSRSSKLIHGGLRYLAQGQVGVTMASVQERRRLEKNVPGLVDPLGFLLVTRKGQRQWRDQLMLQAGLGVYDLLAQQWAHRYYTPGEVWMLAPKMKLDDVAGAFHFLDAQTDDARLVLRLLQEAIRDGGTALNYVRAVQLLRQDEQVVGVRLHDRESGEDREVRARAVINATGAWADRLRAQVGAAARMRPLRGSHLVFPQWRFPVAQAISFSHPLDGRAVFAMPWDGVTLFGTTDLDHNAALDAEPRISGREVAYLMAALEDRFPALGLTLDDVIGTFAGVRPVLDTGKEDPSKESRDHIVLQEDGLLTVTGGKLTIFRVIAEDALGALEERLPEMDEEEDRDIFDSVDDTLPADLTSKQRRRLLGRYGHDARTLVDAAQRNGETDELTPIPGTEIVWAELRWAARAEGVVHLEDLLLRRVRLAHLLPQGGAQFQDRIRAICQPELGWDDARWEAEWTAYQTLWRENYTLPPRATIPDWRAMKRPEEEPARSLHHPAFWPAVAVAGAALAYGVYRYYRDQA